MKVKIGDIVASEFGQGKIVAMSKQWCIYEVEHEEEVAVEWPMVYVPVTNVETETPVTEMEVGTEDETDHALDAVDEVTDEGDEAIGEDPV